MQMNRRKALLGAGAAMAVAGAPEAVKGDPIVALVNKALAYRDRVNASPDDMSDEELDALCAPLHEMFDLIRRTPATSVQGIAAKTRIVWIQTYQSIEYERTGPPDEFDQIGQLAPERFIWSVLQDFERLIGGMRP